MADADTLAGMLADVGIRLKSQRPGHNEHVVCPRCNGGRTKETSLSVTIDQDGAGIAWVCHRGSCGWTGGERVHDAPQHRSPPREAPRKPPPPHSTQQQVSRPDWLYSFFSERNIGARTVEKFGVYGMRRRFPDPIGEANAIVFPYLWKGEIRNRKYRPEPGKNPQLQEPDALPTLFNIDACDNAGTILFCEGEPDVMALWECGYVAVTLKDGAPSKANAANEKRFEALATHADQLGKVKKFVLAGDMDDPGLALREELARRLGRHRCWLVTWPEGCKDACDTLRAHGGDAVEQAIDAAAPYPIEGLQRISAGTLTRLRRLPTPPILTTGTVNTDAVLSLPGDGRLLVLTGFPSNGKTAWLRFVMMHTAMAHERRWVVFSPESQPWEQFAAQCAEVYIGRPFYGENGFTPMSDMDVEDAEAWLSDRVVMLVCDSEQESPTIDWLIDRARAAVLQSGCTDFVIDPWNEVDHQRGDQSETDYIGRALQRLKGFGLRHGVNVWIAAHPRIPPPLKNGESRLAPGPYDISGSANWANKADVGITIHGSTPEAVELTLWKARFRRWGRRGATAAIQFDPVNGRYRSKDAPINHMARQIAEIPPPNNEEMPW